MAKQRLLDSAKTFEYFVLAPPELDQLYAESSKYISRHQSTLDQDTLYTLLYQHFHLALLTGNDAAAKVTVQRLGDRFGDQSPHVGVLKAEYLEATEGVSATQSFLNKRDTTDFNAFKRKTVILKQKGDIKMYIQELLRYLDVCPTDAETWAELAEAYYKTGNYDKAVHALQEVLIQMPQAYNIFARLGEVLHVYATISQTTQDQLGRLKQSIQQFCRSVELCPVYIRGWSGIYVVCEKLTKWPKLSPNDVKTYTELQATARKQLQALVDGNQGTDANIRAAKLILSQSSSHP